MIDVKLRLTGTRPVLMHNVRLANPLDEYAQALKALTGKRNKTEDNYGEMSRIEYLGGLYWDTETGPYIPGEWIFTSFVEAGRLHKQGKKIERGILLGDDGDRNPLQYKGPRDREKLCANDNFILVKAVRVGAARPIRTRPCFHNWHVDVPLFVDPEIIDQDELVVIAERAGKFVGIGDYRPMYGRFNVEVIKS